ncbi:hypothetical protein KI387_023754, partial [Taxus chinensis]
VIACEMDSEVLTDQETAVYDRQIRVWGVDAQRRLSKSRVLVIGVTGVVAELCKNIVLAGIGSLTLMDDSPITSEALSAGFLILAEDSKCKEKSIAEVCQHSLRDFNPMVHVCVEKGQQRRMDEGCQTVSQKMSFHDFLSFPANCNLTVGERKHGGLKSGSDGLAWGAFFCPLCPLGNGDKRCKKMRFKEMVTSGAVWWNEREMEENNT